MVGQCESEEIRFLGIFSSLVVLFAGLSIGTRVSWLLRPLPIKLSIMICCFLPVDSEDFSFDPVESYCSRITFVLGDEWVVEAWCAKIIELDYIWFRERIGNDFISWSRITTLCLHLSKGRLKRFWFKFIKKVWKLFCCFISPYSFPFWS
jgi:hypothetical protein